MIIQRYLLKETGLTFLGVTLLIMLILISATFVRILGDAIEGDYPVNIIFSLLGLKALSNLMMLIPLSFFLAVMMALGRLYRDSEMIAMTACGVRPMGVIRTVGALSLVVAGIAAGLSLYVAPYAEEVGHRVLDEARSRTDIGGLVPGRFNQLGEQDLLVYVEELDPERNVLKKVFVQVREGDTQYLLTAAQAFQQIHPDSGDRYLILKDGYRYERTVQETDYRILRFEEHGLRLQERKAVVSSRRRRAIPTATLLASDSAEDNAELQWRVAAPISTVLLGLLGVLLSKSTPRQGRYGKLFFGILLYVIYYQFMFVARSAVVDEKISPVIGLWWVHLLFLALVVILIRGQKRLPGPKQPKSIVRT